MTDELFNSLLVPGLTVWEANYLKRNRGLCAVCNDGVVLRLEQESDDS